MNNLQRQDLAENIGFFLVGKGLKVWDTWEGLLTREEQLEAFGFYLGNGTIVVNGEVDSVSMRSPVSFGQGYGGLRIISRGISAQAKGHTAWDNTGKSSFTEYCKSNSIVVGNH